VQNPAFFSNCNATSMKRSSTPGGTSPPMRTAEAKESLATTPLSAVADLGKLRCQCYMDASKRCVPYYWGLCNDSSFTQLHVFLTDQLLSHFLILFFAPDDSTLKPHGKSIVGHISGDCVHQMLLCHWECRPLPDTPRCYLSFTAFQAGDIAGPKRFPDRLYELLNADSAPSSLYWLPGGKAFAIDQDNFATEVLDRYFQATKFASFIRRLHKW
jgi:HSF-type DNA-binding